MPIYEYRCDECNKEFEEVVLGEAEVQCPSCASKKTHKLMSTCRTRFGGNSGPGPSLPSAGGGSCAGCSGGSCSTC
jgi:putative FmdB family regulatory protein